MTATLRQTRGGGANQLLLPSSDLTRHLAFQIGWVDPSVPPKTLHAQLQGALKAQVDAGMDPRQAIIAHHVLVQALLNPDAHAKLQDHLLENPAPGSDAAVQLEGLAEKAKLNRAIKKVTRYAESLQKVVTAAVKGDDNAFRHIFDTFLGIDDAEAASGVAAETDGTIPSAPEQLLKSADRVPQDMRSNRGIAALPAGKAPQLKKSRLLFLSVIFPWFFQDDLFILPTEVAFPRAREIFRRSPGGAYVTVGTERSLAAAALSTGISDIVQIDISPNVLAYNAVNTALLRIAKNRSEYLHLRVAAPHSEWLALAEQRGLPKDLEALTLSNFKAWRRWQAQAAKGPNSVFREMPHLRSDELFQNVKALADQDRIRTFRLDLGDAEAVQSLARSLRENGVTIAVLDLSNTWLPPFLGKKFPQVVESFREALTPDSVLILTNMIVDVIFGKLKALRSPKAWWSFRGAVDRDSFDYYGFTFADIDSYKSPEGLSGIETLYQGLIPGAPAKDQLYKANRMNSIQPLPGKPFPVGLLWAIMAMMILQLLLRDPDVFLFLVRAVKWIFS